MIDEDQQILYVMEGNAIVYFKHHHQKKIINAGFTCKKIVITTDRLLIFESLGNRLQETEYQLTANMAKKPNKDLEQIERKPRISVCGLPQVSIDILGIESKIVIDQEPDIYKFLQRQNIQNISKSTVGVVLLRIPKKMKYYMIHAEGVSGALKLAKAIICSQCWKKYRAFCIQNRLAPNYFWVRIMTETIQNDDSVILIDPDLFVTGSYEEIQTFIFLISIIPFAHCFHHRYNITSSEAAKYASDFITAVQGKTHSLSFSSTHLTCQHLKTTLGKATLPSLIRLDLSGNVIDDQIFDVLHRTIKNGAFKLTYINLSKNKIKLENPQMLVGMFKVTKSIMNLDLSYNQIDDGCIQSIEKYITLALNPPLEEINLSFNNFSRKMAWRLFVGNLKNHENHPYLKFILYPIPIKKEVFILSDIDFPRHNTTINLNMHSALVQQFQQESIMKHTFEDIPVTAMSSMTINFRRVVGNNVKLPTNRQDLNKTLEISNKIENFIIVPQPVQSIYGMALLLKKFPLEVPPASRAHFIKYLYQKFNDALFIRDHYSVKYLLMALESLNIQVQGYADRLSKLRQRNHIYQKRAENLMNFEIDETRINEQLDQLVREGLRLYLEGHGVQIIYYLKYKRDQYIEKYLQEKLNPEHYLFDLMAKQNINAQQRVSEKQFIIPYEIRLQKKINQHFYLHPWQANYQILSEMKAETFDACLQFLEESEKKQKFALYFDRIQERIEFIKNQFTYFSFNKFKASYSDLKINACRLLFLYNNIKDTNLYLEIPIYVKKRLVTQEKVVHIMNKEWFRKEYHIVNYPNINLKARKANFFNYEGVIVRYQAEMFQNQVKKILPTLNKILKMIQTCISIRKPVQSIIPNIIDHIRYIVDIVRHSLLPEELKEEIYLHLISWRKGRFGSNTQILQLLPAFTMYLKPPLQIEKYLVAAILQNQKVDLDDFPLCLVTNPNEPTGDNIMILENDFVERDWIPPDNYLTEIFSKKGNVTFDVELLDKKTITITVPESKTVAELMVLLTDRVELMAEDREHFWLYKMIKQTQEIIPYQSREHVGQILADFDPKESFLLLKRRLYSRQLKYNYSIYGQNMINSLYNQVKYQYMCHNFFVNDKLTCDIGSIFFMIENIENMLLEAEDTRRMSMKSSLEDESIISKTLIEKQKNLQSTFLNYIPLKIYKRLMKPKEIVVNELRARISQRILKNEYSNIYEMKLNVLNIFSKFPEFASTNYQVMSKQKTPMRLSINAMYISVQYSEKSEIINLQKIVTIMPKAKYILLYYHKQQNLITQLPIFGDQKILFAFIMDIFSYCSLRIKMSSINLYEIYNLEATEIKIAALEFSLRKIYEKEVDKDLAKCKEDYEVGYKKIGKMSLTLMHFKQLQYYSKSHYLKSEVNRKLYANKSDRRLQITREFDEEQQEEVRKANKKIMHMIFPKLEMKAEEDQSEQEIVMRDRRKTFEDPNESLDYRKEYDKLDTKTNKNKQEKPSYVASQPTEKKGGSPNIRPMEEPLDPNKEEEEDVVTTEKKKKNPKRGPHNRGF